MSNKSNTLERLLDEWIEADPAAAERWIRSKLAVQGQPEQQAEPKLSDRRPYGDLRNAKWLDPECYGAGACQSLKFKARYKNVDITSVLQKALDALEENNQFHIDHDDHSGYIGSEIWELNRLVTSEVREAIGDINAT